MEIKEVLYPIEPVDTYVFKAVVMLGFGCIAVMMTLAFFSIISMTLVMLAILILCGYVLFSGSDHLHAWLAYKKELEDYRDIMLLRELTRTELNWLKDHEPDCIVYVLPNHHGSDHWAGDSYIEFRNKTDEMLFTLAMGQRETFKPFNQFTHNSHGAANV